MVFETLRRICCGCCCSCRNRLPPPDGKVFILYRGSKCLFRPMLYRLFFTTRGKAVSPVVTDRMNECSLTKIQDSYQNEETHHRYTSINSHLLLPVWLHWSDDIMRYPSEPNTSGNGRKNFPYEFH
jgi:hypothetical protein